ncbi:uncharacterized protein CLBA1-like isoform X2 [Rhinatrema bivittatum]|uniref:uncharacterized protein CLBA1-like isoform X2 n=1 Tax=Rhinatrema bivittatum TaxID=194408 RepID=UPI00112DBB42|nr:uncharacterized protein CLBA1-like isoform X2 [Rhinatrema bivittatum]
MTLEKLQSGLWEAVGEARICASVGLPENTAAASTVTEHSNSWGDFEGFTESVAKSESFNNMLEALVPVSDSLQNVAAVNQTHCTTSGHDYPESTEHDRRNAAADSGAEVSLSYEDIFKFSFPDGPVQQSPEIVISLNRLLETSSEEKGGVELVEAQLGVNSVSTWRTIHGMSTGSGLRCSWHEFTCCKNIMFALGINADQKNVSGGADHFVVGTNLDAEETEVDGLGLNGSRALIQTKHPCSLLGTDYTA